MPTRCIIHQILQGELDPNEVPIEVLHASCIRMLTNFTLHPTRELAATVAGMLSALSQHENRLSLTTGGHDLYACAARTWERIAAAHLPRNATRADENRETILH